MVESLDYFPSAHFKVNMSTNILNQVLHSFRMSKFDDGIISHLNIYIIWRECILTKGVYYGNIFHR